MTLCRSKRPKPLLFVLAPRLLNILVSATRLLVMKADTHIEQQILDYLEENPEAQDTLEGIVEWWLLKRKIVEATTAVKSALAKLVAQGRLEARKGSDGRVHYRAGRPR